MKPLRNQAMTISGHRGHLAFPVLEYIHIRRLCQATCSRTKHSEQLQFSRLCKDAFELNRISSPPSKKLFPIGNGKKTRQKKYTTYLGQVANSNSRALDNRHLVRKVFQQITVSVQAKLVLIYGMLATKQKNVHPEKLPCFYAVCCIVNTKRLVPSENWKCWKSDSLLTFLLQNCSLELSSFLESVWHFQSRFSSSRKAQQEISVIRYQAPILWQNP